MKKLVFVGILFLTGCGPVKTNVYGGSGKVYTAPSLCDAILLCQKSESECYYDNSTVVDSYGKVYYTNICQKVK